MCLLVNTISKAMQIAIIAGCAVMLAVWFSVSIRVCGGRCDSNWDDGLDVGVLVAM